ncbi:MAG: hypothetical protein M3319_04645 [Actinomycetota bacterium]|nr:hypothetical protein [Actinomycetota bacterium]
MDTGPIVAVINDRDDHHRECTYLLERLPGPLLIPATVATEVCLMLERRRGTYAELAFLSDVRAGRYTLIESLSADLHRIAELVEKYDDLPFGDSGRLGDRVGRAAEHHYRRDPRSP